jgi:DNA-binding SARP family transcriptional activator
MLARTSCPVLYEPVARERLFTLLDEARGHPLVSITGPPGCGKTTLAATWLQAREVPYVWYQLSAADQDPITFLHYLRLAAQRVHGTQRILPPLGPESSRDIPAFARRYLGALLASLGEDAILVLDNLHEASRGSPLYPALAGALEDRTGAAQLILISRERPHCAFAGLEASRAMSVVSAQALEFTLEETQALLHARTELDPALARPLHDLCRGWAAGLSLLIERSRRGELSDPVAAKESLQDLFQYFAEEIFAGIPPSEQLVLLRLSELPRFNVQLAMQVSADEAAAGIVEQLYRKNLLVDLYESRPGAASYQFHNLFRSFLRRKAAASFSAAQLAAARRSAALLLARDGAIEDAFALLVEADDWKGACAIIYQHAESLLREGRGLLLETWIASLPAECIANDPWLLYWSGAAQIGRAPGPARDRLQQAYALATAKAQSICRAQSVAGIIETIFLEYSDFARLDPWIEILHSLLTSLTFPDSDSELRVYAALVGAVLQRQGNPPAMHAYVEHTFALIAKASNSNLKIAAATHLLRYGVLVGRMTVAKRALAMAQPILAGPDVTSLRKGLCEQFVAWYYLNVPLEGHAREVIQRIERRGKEDHLPELRRFAVISSYWVEMSHLRVAEAARWLQIFESVINPASAYDAGCLAEIKAWSCMASGDAATAMYHAAEAVAWFDQAGSCWHRIFSRGVISWVCAENKDNDQAVRWLNEARSLAREASIDALDVQFDQVDAMIGDHSDERLRPLLARFLSSAAEHGTGLPLRFFPTVAPRLCALALKLDVSRSYTRALIRTWKWRSEDPTLDDWPWPVRIYTLGRFELYVRDERVNFSGHAPRKVLLLLKALMCLGVSSIRDRRLISAVWPGEDTEAGKASFHVTLHRLRKLLQHPDAIAVEDGVVTLNTEVCWIDAVAFERLLDTPDSPERVNRAIALYRGNLLPEDDEERWSTSYREKLRRNFLHQVLRIGTALEASEQWQPAIELYQRALDADNLVESFYQGLMRCYWGLDRRCEAISVYQRMRRLLSVTLGLEPSAASDALYRSLLSSPP